MQATRQQIIIGEDGIARYERTLVLPGTNGTPSEQRLLEEKRVDAAVLEPDRGQLPILPMHCRAIRQRDGAAVFVIEEPPGSRTVCWKTFEGAQYEQMTQRLYDRDVVRAPNEERDAYLQRLRAEDTFTLAFPYIVKFFHFVDDVCVAVYCFYRFEGIGSPLDELFIPNLPNQTRVDNGLQLLCLPEDVRQLRCRAGVSYTDIITTIEQAFWGSAWNAHWNRDFFTDAPRIAEVASPWEWARASAQDPTFVLRVPWREARCSLGETVRTLFGVSDAPSTRFACLHQRIIEADVWDGAPAGSVVGVPVSPSRVITVGEDVLEIGGSLTLPTNTFTECVDGGTFPIEWFSRAEQGDRFVKLAGVAAPILVVHQGQLRDGLVYVAPQPDVSVVLNGVPVEQGTICCFLDRERWFGREQPVFIQRVRQDAVTGTVSVQLHHEHTFLVIGEGDALAPGLLLIAREDADREGNLRAACVTLPDGTTIRKGDSFYMECGAGQCRMVTVERFRALTPDHLRRDAVAADGLLFRIEHEDGCLHPCLLRVPEAPLTAVRVGSQTIAIGDRMRFSMDAPEVVEAFTPMFMSGRRYVLLARRGWQCLSEGNRLVPVIVHLPEVTIDSDATCVRVGAVTHRAGALFNPTSGRIVHAVRFERDAAGAVHAVLGDDTRVPFITDDRRASVWESIALQCDVGPVRIERGMELRLTRPVRMHRNGKRFVVHHIVPADLAGGAPLVVTACGRGFVLTHENARCFAWRDARGCWQALPDDAACYGRAPDAPREGEGLAVGMRVRYLGGDGHASFRQKYAETLAMATPGTIVGVGWSERFRWWDWLVQFDMQLPGCHDARGRFAEHRYQYIREQYLVPCAPAVVTNAGFVRVFAAGGVDCVRPGTVAAHDRNGRVIRVGDRVRATALIRSASVRAMWHTITRRPFTVVHRWRGGDGVWLWLDAGKDIAGTEVDGSMGQHELPMELRAQPAWWRRCTLAIAHECVVVD